jgi:hypothetical protein
MTRSTQLKIKDINARVAIAYGIGIIALALLIIAFKLFQ